MLVGIVTAVVVIGLLWLTGDLWKAGADKNCPECGDPVTVHDDHCRGCGAELD